MSDDDSVLPEGVLPDSDLPDSVGPEAAANEDPTVEGPAVERTEVGVVRRSGFLPSGRLAYIAIPAAAVLAAGGAGLLGWQYASHRDRQKAASESVAVARDTTIVILSYSPETVDAQLNGARDRLTGSFLEAYTKLVNDVVIPGAKEKKISAAAKVPAAASVSADDQHAVVLVFVNQTVTVAADPGKSAPSTTNSSVRVTMDKVDGRWLVSGFDPV